MVLGMPTERVTIRLPQGFDPNRHIKALVAKITEIHGEGFSVDSIDPDEGVAYATRQVAVTEVSAAANGHDGHSAGKSKVSRKEVRLPRGTKPSDGEKVAAKLADQHPGYAMVSFEPFLGRALLSTMDERTQRAREAVAVALGSKPWDIQITGRSDGGFDLTLPARYVPSKHDDKLAEVASVVVGRDGWTFTADPQSLRASIVPGEPPTFPAKVAYPMENRPSDWTRLPLGVCLGKTGLTLGPELTTDFVANPHMSIQGLTGAGKGVSLMALMSGALAAGWELAVCDAVKGGVDYITWQPFVRTSGWGDDLSAACTVVALVYQEGVRRKSVIQQHRVQKWTELPDIERPRPLLLIVDELTSLITPEPTPKGVPKDNPLYVEIAERNLMKATILNAIGKIAREMRFTGVSLVVATQVASTSTGVPTELRANLGAKVLLGVKPTDNNRRLALSDQDAVPEVPGYLADDADASRGVGVFEFEGRQPGVMKVYFATPAEYATWLTKQGITTNDRPRPSAAEIARHTPSLQPTDSTPPSGSAAGPEVDPVLDPVTGEELHGFAKANEQRRRLSSSN